MMNIKGVAGLGLFLLIGVGVMIGVAIGKYDNTQQKYKMSLKCIQGELYEEIRPNIYAKSHLECFEQKTLVP